MYQIFGEDAENMAWLLFFEFIFAYRGTDFIRLPGLVRRFLIFRLLNGAKHIKLRFDSEQLDEFDPDGVLSKTLTADSEENSLSNVSFAKLLDKLPDKQQLVLQEIYLKGKSQAQVAKTLNCTPRSVRNYKNSAINRIKKRLKT